jgi:hypothetical protein
MNFPNFPLYETLKKEEFKELTDEEKDELFSKIKLMSDEKQEILYALIKAYYIEDKQQFLPITELPYSGKVLKNRLKFDLDQIPSKLQSILKSFSMIN